jgi:hypothetical protein
MGACACVAQVTLPELEAWVTATIAALGGDVQPKLNWSTPKARRPSRAHPRHLCPV